MRVTLQLLSPKKVLGENKLISFLEAQAQVDGTNSIDVDDETRLDGFIANNTIYMEHGDGVDMHAKYFEKLVKSISETQQEFPNSSAPSAVNMN